MQVFLLSLSSIKKAFIHFFVFVFIVFGYGFVIASLQAKVNQLNVEISSSENIQASYENLPVNEHDEDDENNTMAGVDGSEEEHSCHHVFRAVPFIVFNFDKSADASLSSHRENFYSFNPYIELFKPNIS